MKEWKHAPDGVLNLVASPYAQPLAAFMEREFGIPFLSLHTMFSVEQIDAAYDETAQRLGISWDNSFQKERDEALAFETQAKAELAGLGYIVSLGATMPLALAAYLNGFAMEPLLLHMEEFYPEDKAHAKRLLSMGQDPYICRMVNMQAEFSLLQSTKPTVCFGNLPPVDPSIATVPNMFGLHGCVGYGLPITLLGQTFQALNLVRAIKKGETSHGVASV